MENTKAIDLTKGSIYKQMLLYFFPILIGNFFQQLYNTVDAVIVGRFIGKNALGCVGGSSAMILQLILGFFIGLSSGAAVVVSQYIGAGDKEKVKRSIQTIYFISIIGSLLVILIFIWCIPFSLKLMKTPDELMDGSILYLRVYFAGTLFIFIYNAGSAILRALGDSKHPLNYLIICAALNVVLDIIFVVLLDMGIAGAALATVLAQAVSAVFTTLLLIKTADLDLYGIFHPDMKILVNELRIGIPYGFEWTMYNLPNMVVQTGINSYGTDALAAWAAYWKIDGVFWMICGSVGVTVTTFSGQNFGAGKLSRVRKGIRGVSAIVIGLTLCYSFLVIRISAPLMRIFVTDENVIALGVYMISVLMPWYFLYVPIEILTAALRGFGDVVIPLVITIIGICAVRVGWVIVVEKLYHKMFYILINYPVTWIFTTAMFLLYYFYRIRRVKLPGREISG